MRTDNHEVIFAIANSGYADDVMDIARSASKALRAVFCGKWGEEIRTSNFW